MSGPGSDPEPDIVSRLRAQGRWNPVWDGVADLDPQWTQTYLEATLEPYESGVLSPREVELICIAVDAACTHLFAPGLRRHMRAALELGVSSREILEVLKLSTTLGIHSLNVGLPILVEAMATEGADHTSR